MTWHTFATAEQRQGMAVFDGVIARIRASFTDWSECQAAESYRGWLDENGIEAENAAGWFSSEAADFHTVDRFIAYEEGR
ncbi:hypothetical protein [Methylobacterium sp. Gmos1]